MIARIAIKWGVGLGVAICVWTWMLHILGWYTTDLAKSVLISILVWALMRFVTMRSNQAQE